MSARDFIDYQKANIRAAIDEYFRLQPKGLDVTAYVLDRLGVANMNMFAKRTKKTMDTAKKDFGREMSEEYLPQMFESVRKLSTVKVDSEQFPRLASWVSSYTQHEVGPRKKW
jgi:hypothetical protein